MKTYTIKSLKWEGGKDTWGCSSYSASTPFGEYRVFRNVWFCDDCLDNPKGCGGDVDTATTQCGEYETWNWGYCFDEYYDEDTFDCKTLAEGKTAAQNHWEERLRGALKELTK